MQWVLSGVFVLSFVGVSLNLWTRLNLKGRWSNMTYIYDILYFIHCQHLIPTVTKKQQCVGLSPSNLWFPTGHLWFSATNPFIICVIFFQDRANTARQCRFQKMLLKWCIWLGTIWTCGLTHILCFLDTGPLRHTGIRYGPTKLCLRRKYLIEGSC